MQLSLPADKHDCDCDSKSEDSVHPGTREIEATCEEEGILVSAPEKER